METRGEIQQRRLEEVLTQYETIAGRVLERVKNRRCWSRLGVDLLSVYFVAAKPTPEVAKAWRPNTARPCCARPTWPSRRGGPRPWRKKRKIKENELNTEITLEEQRGQLIDLQGDNAMQEAGNKGKAVEEEAAYRTGSSKRSWSFTRHIDPRKVLALAMAELATMPAGSAT